MCVVAKVLECCIYNRLIGHMENMISTTIWTWWFYFNTRSFVLLQCLSDYHLLFSHSLITYSICIWFIILMAPRATPGLKNDSISDDISIPTTPVCEEIISDIILVPSEVYDVLNCLYPSKASGPDNIPIRLLKECAHSITPSLTCLFNKSLKQASLPSEWKLSNIIPLHKKGIKSFVEN